MPLNGGDRAVNAPGMGWWPGSERENERDHYPQWVNWRENTLSAGRAKRGDRDQPGFGSLGVGVMARVVGVHGIAQQVKGSETLAASWVPALRDGVRLSGSEPPEPSDVVIAFYGDVFRKPGAKAFGEPDYIAEDVEDPLERDLLLELWWGEAARADSGVTGPDEKTKLRTPSVVQRALNALSQSKFFAGLGEHLIIALIKQVRAYLTDERIREAAQQRLCAAVQSDTVVLVGHSLGSVVAYEAVCAHPEWPVSLVTLGCPLGIRNIVFDRLRPPPVGQRGVFPPGVRSWTNIADRGDVVALVKSLQPLFGGGVTDLLVNNGPKAHDVSPYLTAVETGRVIASALAQS